MVESYGFPACCRGERAVDDAQLTSKPVKMMIMKWRMVMYAERIKLGDPAHEKCELQPRRSRRGSLESLGIVSELGLISAMD